MPHENFSNPSFTNILQSVLIRKAETKPRRFNYCSIDDNKNESRTNRQLWFGLMTTAAAFFRT